MVSRLAATSSASRRRRTRSVRQSLASSTAARVRLPLYCSQLALELVEQGEGVGAGAGEAGEDLAVVQAAHLASAVLHDGVAEGHLAVAGHDDAAAVAQRENRGAATARPAARSAATGWAIGCDGSTSRCEGARVRRGALVVDLHQLVEVDVGVLLRRRQAGVAEQLLDRAQVGAGAEQVGGEAVAQGVRADLGGEAAAHGVVRRPARATERAVESAAALVEKDRCGRRGAARAELAELGRGSRSSAVESRAHRSARRAPCCPCRAPARVPRTRRGRPNRDRPPR